MEKQLIPSGQRKVTVFTTAGNKGKSWMSSATTLGAFKSEMRNNSFEYDNMKIIEGDTKHTLETDEATLPIGEFTLFLMPKATKSGASSRPAIKEAIEKYGDVAKKHFNQDKNYTIKKEEELSKLLSSWNKKSAKIKPVAPPKKVAPAKKPVPSKAPIAPKKTPAPKKAEALKGEAKTSPDKGKIGDAKRILSSVTDSRIATYVNLAINNIEAAEAILNNPNSTSISMDVDTSALSREASRLGAKIPGIR